MKSEKWIATLKAEGYTPRAYSGRGMGGTYCVSIVVSDWPMDAANLSESSLPRGAKAIIAEARTDSMGWKTVVYWPNLAWSNAMAAEETAQK